MRVLVTGATNAHGKAIVEALLQAGHQVRAFGVPVGEQPFGELDVECFPGRVEIGGSVEPAAAECQMLIHAANLDAPGRDDRAHAFHLERGTLYARYAAERELVQKFIALFPSETPRKWQAVLVQAESHVKATRTIVPHQILRVGEPADAATQVLQALSVSAV